MARPQFLQTLKHGKLLTKIVFPFFVDTWNYIIRRCDGIRGDKDLNENHGFIRVDNADPENPVIRFEPPYDFWNRGRGDGYDGYDGCFEYSVDDGTVTLKNPYYRIGGVTYTMEDEVPTMPNNGILALKIDASSGSQSAEYVTYSSVSAMQAEEDDYDYFIAPLYTFQNGAIVCDWRKGVPVIMTEY